MSHQEAIASSFRDPGGFVYLDDGEIFRRINQPCMADYRQLMDSGLYHVLVDRGWLVAHEEQAADATDHLVIKPRQIQYVAYPYEWSFSQYKAAALLTLKVQKLALAHDMTLKDASAYNVQFLGCDPVFIDTLSLQRLDATLPWVAYKQFCEHFLGPLALMCRREPRLRKLLLGFIDGLPLELVSRTLPLTTRLNYSLLVHIHLHARSQAKHAADESASSTLAPKMNKQLLLALVESLVSAIEGCRLSEQQTEWGDYYDDTNYSDAAMRIKQQLVGQWVKRYAQPGQLVHDLGANTGRFSRVAAGCVRYVVAHDIDELAVDRNYRTLADEGNYTNILPLVLDLANPSPAIGWAHRERNSFAERCEGGFVLALALIHHLAIGNNTPLPKVAEFFADFASTLLIEFVPKKDTQVRRLLASREDIFPDYHPDGFESAFSAHFTLREKQAIPESERFVYLWTRRGLSKRR